MTHAEVGWTSAVVYDELNKSGCTCHLTTLKIQSPDQVRIKFVDKLDIVDRCALRPHAVSSAPSTVMEIQPKLAFEFQTVWTIGYLKKS